MASVASQMIEEFTAHAQSGSLGDAREICADGTYFPNNLRRITQHLLANIIKKYNVTNGVTVTVSDVITPPLGSVL